VAAGPPVAGIELGYLDAARTAAAHVFVDDLGAPTLAEVDRHHLERVLRLRAGEVVSAVDGRGGWCLCAFTGSGGTARVPGRLEVIGERLTLPEPQVAVTVGFALTKGDRPEWAVQKLTEIGVDRIIPLVTARSVVRWDGDRADRHLGRLREVARLASMQSRRLRLPVIDGVATLAELSQPSELSQSSELSEGMPGVALATVGGGPPTLAHPTILVGPEGGWSQEEESGTAATVGLGPTVLRTETAAVVAGAYLCALRGAVLSPIP
jgi:16S rRNA (uracil1498-N3)-methyltransferase